MASETNEFTVLQNKKPISFKFDLKTICPKLSFDWDEIRKSTTSSLSSEDEVTKRKIYADVYQRMTDHDSESSGDEYANFNEVYYGSTLNQEMIKRRMRGSTNSTDSESSVFPTPKKRKVESNKNISNKLPNQGITIII
ncbi:uncharacterized protein LOC144419999 [Styela clava]